MDIKVKHTSVGRGLGWLSDGIEYFLGNPMGWIGALIVTFINHMSISLVPVLGLLAIYFLPLVLGYFILLSVIIGSIYVAYKDCFDVSGTEST